MKRLHQKGFSAVEGLLIFVALALLGGVIYYVYNANRKTSDSLDNINSSKNTSQKTNNQTPQEDVQADEAADWTVFTSSNGWSMRIPDGWNLYTNTSTGGLSSGLSLEYKPGTRGVVEELDGGRGGPFLLNIAPYSTSEAPKGRPIYLKQEADFKAKNITGKKYYGMLDEDEPMIGSRGDTVYQYNFTKNGKTLVVYSYQPQNSASILTQLEKSLSTLEIL